ncbi:radical SAM/CxCxxxxC motif protein YfkAB [Alkalibacillus salilacus]|uniref:Radical SAM/CxCxxxxC motif protein YfkAB n=1 Tax=Alkalibacillus salilacus TaxID=284582 RepID=A0ABT9VEN0_9BACI|nr:radical SAM/CxCxxxxC motif protein YfkAB [Alkalibacillus salilacus]MDQ0159432.1 radical SAM/CxCxxxxC motif protein YfkAB [Alkalibacillus salilacus]
MQMSNQHQELSPSYDPWEAYMDVDEHGELVLSNIEFTTTHLCNMRCRHCAVGDTLMNRDPDPLPIDVLLKRLDEVPHLRTLSITGGEPMLSKKSVEQYVVPLLRYAHERGVRTQINSNLTLPYERYEAIVPYLDVLHISHNWGTVDEFAETGFALMERKPSFDSRAMFFDRLVDNSQRLSAEGVMVSAETMLNGRTYPHLQEIHEHVLQMGCARHEIHPMYPVDFAKDLETLSLDEMKHGIRHLLDIRDEDVWMLFGTLPFYPCSQSNDDLELLQRLDEAKNVTVRNDPDGRSRLNVNIFSGEVTVTDFGDEPSLGNIQHTPLVKSFDQWMASNLAQSLNCHCPMAKCLGPNVLVKDTYYPNVDFQKRQTKISLQNR